MPSLSEFKDETWEEFVAVEVGDNRVGYRRVKVEQGVGFSGVYRVETDASTGEVIRDDRPWQMR